MHLVPATAPFSQNAAHMQARGPKGPPKSLNPPNSHIPTIFNWFLNPPGRPWTPRGANRTTRWRSYAGKMAVGAVKLRFWTERYEIGRPRRPFYLHMSAIGWSDLPPAGLKAALEGPKSFKFLRARAQTTVFNDDFGVDRPPGQDFARLRAKT